MARVAKARLAEGMIGNLIQTVVRPLERFAVSGSYAVGVYLAMSTNDPVYIGALFAFLMLSQRVSGPLMQMAQLINQYDEARIAVAIVGKSGQPAARRRALGPRRAGAASRGTSSFPKVTLQVQGAVTPALNEVSFEVPIGGTLGDHGQERLGQDHDHAAVAAAAFGLRGPDQDRWHRRARI